MMIRVSLLAFAAYAPGFALAQATECGPFPSTGDSYGCTCAADVAAGPVWGSGPYTADSDICTAARHAGVLDQEGGRVVAQAVEAPASFAGTVSNGVTSMDYGIYPRAYALEGASLGVGVEMCERLGPRAVTVCTCPAGEPLGTVWGTDPYTDDSDVCTAARHAGVIGPEGGEVTVRRVAGRESYEGSTMNGVTSSPHGTWEASFTFGAKGG